MGYYDQGRHTEKKQSGRRVAFFSGFAGVLIGAILMFAFLPKFTHEATVPNEQNTNQQQENNENVPTKTVNVNVESDIIDAVSHVSDAVVGVINLQRTNFWEGKTSEAGAGSGVIYKKAGDRAFVVTNHHVVSGANDIEVTLSNDERVAAKLVGADPLMDLAVLEIDGSQVTNIAEFGSSEDLKLGEPAIAIGNPLGFLEGTVTAGIISNIERTIPIDLDGDGIPDWNAEVIQTDASINPGNSGGALVNIEGQVIGINSSKIAQAAVEGIGFAIPIDSAKPIIADLEQFGEVKRPFLGVQLQDLTEIPAYHVQQTLKLPDEVEEGVVIMSVVTNSPSERAGLQELDVITELDGQPIENVLQLRKYLYNEKAIGDQIEVTYYREGEKQVVSVQLIEQTY